MKSVIWISAVFLLAGCDATKKLPLCQSIAEKSFDTFQEGQLLNRFLSESVAARKIEVEVLSPFMALYSGPEKDIKWLEENYGELVCGFNPRLDSLGGPTYTTCIRHVPNWITAVNSDEPQALFNSKYFYQSSCLVR